MHITLQTALAVHQSGDLEEAEHLYLILLEEYPEDTDILHLLGILNAQKQNLEAALFYVQKAISITPNVPSFYNSLGNIYKHQKKWQKATESYYQAIELNPSNAQALTNLGNLLYDQEKWLEAIKHYQAALKINPNSADTYCNLGLAFKKMNNDQEAQIAFKKAIAKDPLQSIARMELGKFAQLSGNDQEAIIHYEYCLQKEPEYLEAINNLGAIFLAQKNFSKAIEKFKKVLIKNPKHIESLANLGNAYLQSEQLDPALHCYLKLLEVKADFDTYYNLGVIYMYKEHHQSAIDYFNQALKLKSNDFNTQMNLGSIYLKLENPLKAIEHYESALKLSPQHPEICYLLSALKQHNSNFTSAPKEYIQSLFDQYAPYFDAHLKNYLHYQSPQALFKAVSEYTGTRSANWNILDLGCGTGLCGVLFRPLAKSLIGIDLSQKMLDVANLKGCYDALIAESIESALPKFENQDIVIASDVFTYIGDLTHLFHLVSLTLKFKGFFAFTTEKTTQADYILQSSARFAHNLRYIERLSQQTGFDIVLCENLILREQKKQPLEGILWLLQKK